MKTTPQTSLPVRKIAIVNPEWRKATLGIYDEHYCVPLTEWPVQYDADGKVIPTAIEIEVGR